MSDEVNGITWRDRDRALYLPLLGGAKTSAAHSLVDELFQELVVPRMAGRQMRPTSLAKNRRALEALVGDLCRYRAQGRDGKHGMSPKDFSSRNLGFGLTPFRLVKDALNAANLICFRGGYNYVGEGFAGPQTRYGGDVAFFRLSPALVERLGELCGPKARTHWSHGQATVPMAEPLLILRGRKVGRDPPKDLPYDPHEPGVAELLAGIEATNSFLTGRVDGIAFGGLRRIYNDGDVASKRWRRGGRYYSIPGGESYEMMGSASRLKELKLDGVAIAEVDMRASQLTVLHGVLHLPFINEGDPYEFGEIHRQANKTFINSSFGHGSVRWARWSLKSREDYAQARPGHDLATDYSVAKVRRAVLVRYPFMHDLGAEDGVNSLDLAWHEAEIVTHAMQLLRNRDIASLPVHDSLLVPWNKVDEAMDAIVEAYSLHFESDLVRPLLKVSSFNI